MKATAPAPPTPCKSVFRAGTEKVTKENYTQLWISLINQMERSKKILAGAK